MFFMKQTKKQPKQIEFRLEPKKKFDCFEDTLIGTVRIHQEQGAYA